jgi:hypothetical protein
MPMLRFAQPYADRLRDGQPVAPLPRFDWICVSELAGAVEIMMARSEVSEPPEVTSSGHLLVVDGVRLLDAGIEPRVGDA